MNLAGLYNTLRRITPVINSVTQGIGSLNAGMNALQIAEPQYAPISATEVVQSNIDDLLSEAAAEEYGNIDDQYNRSSFRDLAEELMPYTSNERSARSVLQDGSLGLDIPDGRYFDFGNGTEDPMEGFMPMDPRTGMYLPDENRVPSENSIFDAYMTGDDFLKSLNANPLNDSMEGVTPADPETAKRWSDELDAIERANSAEPQYEDLPQFKAQDLSRWEGLTYRPNRKYPTIKNPFKH